MQCSASQGTQGEAGRLAGNEIAQSEGNSVELVLQARCRHLHEAGCLVIILTQGRDLLRRNGRDSMGPAVRTLVTVLDDIKKGRFKPDESRSGRFVEQTQPDQ